MTKCMRFSLLNQQISPHVMTVRPPHVRITEGSGNQTRRETARAREYAATSPLSRVTAAAFPLASEYDTASSPARDYTCVCVCFILCDRLPYTAYVESPALARCLYQVPIVSQSCE